MTFSDGLEPEWWVSSPPSQYAPELIDHDKVPSTQLANRVRYRRVSLTPDEARHLAKRSVVGALLIEAWHIWGISGIQPVAYGAAVVVIARWLKEQ